MKLGGLSKCRCVVVVVALCMGVVLCVVAPIACADEAAQVVAGPSLMLSTGASASSSIIRMIGGLFLCLGIFALIVRMLRRNSKSQDGRRLQVREKVALSSKASLQLVAVDNREFLVSSTAEHISIVPLHSLTTEMFAESLDAVSNDGEAFNA